MDGLC